MKDAFRFRGEQWPLAHSDAQCVGAHFRFTVLTHRLLRLEYSSQGRFEDRASQAVVARDFPSVPFSVRREEGVFTLETAALTLTYAEDLPFSPETLTIQLKGEPYSRWHFGEESEDLGGTAKTLDGVDGACPLGHGVCSRMGFALLDDSDSLVLEADGWVGLREENTVDCYFFGYGFAYPDAVRDLYWLTGFPPLLPAYAFGNWWSRYHAYTQQEYIDLIDRFHREDLPFSVSVIDMDWHLTQVDDPENGNGWTGFTWNRALFPDPKGFLRQLKERNLHSALSLHPHAGVRSFEEAYPAMARECGVDPASGQQLRLDVLSKTYMAAYFDVLLHPYEQDGVDFWWLDWQQGTDYGWLHAPNRDGHYADPRERMDPLWMLNHLHTLDISRTGRRPMFFSRYAGPGSHRYSIGFSGDSIVTWNSLRFQPYFTATASNIGYCWWSHDIGGHMGGERDDELQVRWLQLGVFSPILRLHSTCNQFQRKEPWCYAPETERIMGSYLRLRHSLFPYLYTMNERCHSQGAPLIAPMYYTHPQEENAYCVPGQFWFGSQLIAAPITQRCDRVTTLASTPLYLPKGTWFDFFTGLRYDGSGSIRTVCRALEATPVFAKAGAIVPLARFPKGENRLYSAETLELLVFPCANGEFTLYEDCGDGPEDRAVRTPIRLEYGCEARLTIGPAQGNCDLLPAERTWEILLRGWQEDITVRASIDGVPVSVKPRWDAEHSSLCLTIPAPVAGTITMTVTGECLASTNADILDRCAHILQRSQMPIDPKGTIMAILSAGAAVQDRLRWIEPLCRDYPSLFQALEELLTLSPSLS